MQRLHKADGIPSGATVTNRVEPVRQHAPASLGSAFRPDQRPLRLNPRARINQDLRAAVRYFATLRSRTPPILNKTLKIISCIVTCAGLAVIIPAAIHLPFTILNTTLLQLQLTEMSATTLIQSILTAIAPDISILIGGLILLSIGSEISSFADSLIENEDDDQGGNSNINTTMSMLSFALPTFLRLFNPASPVPIPTPNN